MPFLRTLVQNECNLCPTSDSISHIIYGFEHLYISHFHTDVSIFSLQILTSVPYTVCQQLWLSNGVGQTANIFLADIGYLNGHLGIQVGNSCPE